MRVIRFKAKEWAPLCAFMLLFGVITTSCQGNMADTTPITPIFLQQQEVRPDSMDALLVGELILENSCLRVQDNDNNNYILIWPQGFSLNVAGTAVQIKDGTGGIVAQVGDVVNVGGGEIPVAQIGNYVSQAVPTACSGPYWIVASIKK